MSTRADQITQLKKMPEVYSDFTTAFSVNPFNGNLARVTNDKAITQSLRNLIMTNYGERFFQPEVGSNVNKILFEPNDIIAQEDLQYHITQTITQNEPRVNLVQVVVQPNVVQNSIAVNIVYSIINTQQVQNLNIILNRVR
jgi:phage baseplate assembly protein W